MPLLPTISFPTNPAPGQTYSRGGVTWKYSGPSGVTNPVGRWKRMINDLSMVFRDTQFYNNLVENQVITLPSEKDCTVFIYISKSYARIDFVFPTPAVDGQVVVIALGGSSAYTIAANMFYWGAQPYSSSETLYDGQTYTFQYVAGGAQWAKL